MKMITRKSVLMSFLIAIALFVASCGGKKESDEETKDGANETTEVKKSDVEVPAGALKIGFIRSDSINEKYLYLIDRKKELENESIKAEGALKSEYARIAKRQQELEGKFKFMTMSEQQAAQEEMMKLSEKYQSMEQKLAQEVQEKNMFFQKQLYENVEAYLAKYAEANNFDFIFRYEMGMGMMFGAKKFDVTSDVLKGLNNEYKSSMGK